MTSSPKELNHGAGRKALACVTDVFYVNGCPSIEETLYRETQRKGLFHNLISRLNVRYILAASMFLLISIISYKTILPLLAGIRITRFLVYFSLLNFIAGAMWLIALSFKAWTYDDLNGFRLEFARPDINWRGKNVRYCLHCFLVTMSIMMAVFLATLLTERRDCIDKTAVTVGIDNPAGIDSKRHELSMTSVEAGGADTVAKENGFGINVRKKAAVIRQDIDDTSTQPIRIGVINGENFKTLVSNFDDLTGANTLQIGTYASKPEGEEMARRWFRAGWHVILKGYKNPDTNTENYNLLLAPFCYDNREQMDNYIASIGPVTIAKDDAKGLFYLYSPGFKDLKGVENVYQSFKYMGWDTRLKKVELNGIETHIIEIHSGCQKG